MTKKTKIITKYEIDLVADLFFEQEDKILGTCYKSGFIYSIYVIFRAFKFFSIKEKIHSHLQLEEGTRTAVVFFLNELNAIQKSHNDYRVDNIIKLSTNNLSIIRSELGIKKTIIEIPRKLKKQLYIPKISAHRHLTRPLQRMKITNKSSKFSKSDSWFCVYK